MSLRYGLTNIVAALAIAFGGCSKSPAADWNGTTYDFNGRIGDEIVSYESPESKNRLTVQRSDGTIVKYVDDNYDNCEIEYVEITKNGFTTRYECDTAGAEVLKIAQVQFNAYRAKILEVKMTEGLNNIRQNK